MHNNKFIWPQIKTTNMESFLPSTTKLWNELPDFIKILPTLSSFKKHLKEFFSKTPNDLYHFWARRCKIIHCQLRNCSSNLHKDLFDYYLSDSPACRNRGLLSLFFLNVQHIALLEKYSLKTFLIYILMSLLHLTYWCLVTLIWITWPMKQFFNVFTNT